MTMNEGDIFLDTRIEGAGDAGAIPKSELVSELRGLAEHTDAEHAHAHADRLLIRYINDPDITEAYEALDKWYA